MLRLSLQTINCSIITLSSGKLTAYWVVKETPLFNPFKFCYICIIKRSSAWISFHGPLSSISTGSDASCNHTYVTRCTWFFVTISASLRYQWNLVLLELYNNWIYRRQYNTTTSFLYTDEYISNYDDQDIHKRAAIFNLK